MKPGAKQRWLQYGACLSIFAVFAAAPGDAKQIGEDDWIDVGRGPGGNLWSIQWLSIINFQLERKSNSHLDGSNAWIRIISKKGSAYKKIYWSINCKSKAYFILSRVSFSPSGAPLSRWDNPHSIAPRAFPTWSYAAPGTVETKVIEAFCTTKATHQGAVI